MKIELNEKTYYCDEVKTVMFYKAIKLAEGMDVTDISTEMLDKAIDFVVDLYGHQFTRDDVINGLKLNRLLPTITESINGVIEEVNGAADEKNE